MKTPTPKRKATTRRTKKGALVNGFSKNLPLEILHESHFRDALREVMRGYSGLYVLYSKKRLYYIGLARNLYGRLHAHTKNKHKGKWDNFAIYRISRVRYLKDIESLLLLVADPPGNSVKGKFLRDGDITKIVKRIQRENVRLQHKISKALR